jgi:hypothetical protein
MQFYSRNFLDIYVKSRQEPTFQTPVYNAKLNSCK